MYYVVSIMGWEEYVPHWFQTKDSKEVFQKNLRKCISKALDSLEIKEEYKWNGHSLMQFILPEMEKLGYKEIKADNEISIGGETSYRDEKPYGDEKPEIFSKEQWNRILKHNAKAHRIFYQKGPKRSKREFN